VTALIVRQSYNRPGAAALQPRFRQTRMAPSADDWKQPPAEASMVYSQSPPLAQDLDVEDLLRDGRARDLDARSERRIDIPIGSPNSSNRRDGQVARDRPSIGRRMFRSMIRFFIVVLIGVGATLAWQSYGDAAREMLAVQAPGLAGLLPVSTKSAVMAAPSADPMQQLAPLASNLEILRRSLEQLAAKQDQMAQNIAALQAVDEDIRQKMLSSPPVQQPASMLQPKPVQSRVEPPPVQPAPAPRRPPPAAPPPRLPN
jgi:hypothetical protein